MWDAVVIGGGITGLAAAHALGRAEEAGRPIRVCLVESAPRLGGKILSERVGGFLVEGGPDSFIVQKPWALELARELGLGDRIVAADDEHRTTYVAQGGRLVPLPEGLGLLVPAKWGPVLRSPLLSWGAKLRLAREGRVPPRRDESDESVADFVRRRLGDEILESLAEPLLAHIHVADVERMSLAATYPRLAELERRYGSLTAGVRTLARRGPGRPASPVFLTLRGGLGELVERLAGRIPAGSVRLGRRVRRVAGGPGGSPSDSYAVELDDGTALATRTIVFAVPAWAAAGLVESYDPGLARRLGAIRYASMATLSLGYRRRELERPLAGYGFFVPRREQRTILACTWTSSKFAGRAPDAEHALVRLFLGGALGEEVLARDDATLTRLAREDLRALLGIRAEPVLERLYRWPRGYPQYEVGHPERVREIEAALPPGWAIAGSPYHGVGLPDCVRSAREAASKVLGAIREGVAEVDGGVLAC